MVLIAAGKQLQENQAVAWISKTKEKNPPKQESLVFLETTVHRVGRGDSRKPTKNQGGNQGSRKPSVLVGFLRQKKRTVHTLSGRTGSGHSMFAVFVTREPWLGSPSVGDVCYQGAVAPVTQCLQCLLPWSRGSGHPVLVVFVTRES